MADDLVVLALTIEAALLPEWFEGVRDAAGGGRATRMAVIEKPEAWIVKVELRRERVDDFRAALAERWEAFVARRKAEGRWEEEG